MRGTTLTILCWLLLCPNWSIAGDHSTVVQEYALILGDAAIATKHCHAITVDWARLATEGRLRFINEQDVSALRALAQKRMDTAEAGLNDEASVREWCDDALIGYGPGGLAVDGLLVP